MKKIILVLLCFVGALYADPREDGLKARICNVLPNIEGWCTTEKALNFIDLVLQEKPDVYVEIGVFGGRSLFAVASALRFLNHGIIYGIDPWDKLECIKYYDAIEDQTNLAWWAKVNINYIYNSYLTVLKKYDLEKFCITLKKTSEQAASDIEKIDILYIDGNHSQEASTSDVALYLPKVRQGGYIWMNDSTWETRQEATELLAASCDIVKMIDNGNCVLFKKR